MKIFLVVLIWILMVVQITIHGVKHGDTKFEYYSFPITLITTILNFFLYYYLGAYDAVFLLFSN